VVVDIGFGDAIEPGLEDIDLPVLLDFPAPHLRAYARETVIAEKFQALVALGRANSRMKDYHDIWLMSRSFEFDETRACARHRCNLPPERYSTSYHDSGWPDAGVRRGPKQSAAMECVHRRPRCRGHPGAENCCRRHSRVPDAACEARSRRVARTTTEARQSRTCTIHRTRAKYFRKPLNASFPRSNC
jgi:hypothetical protein